MYKVLTDELPPHNYTMFLGILGMVRKSQLLNGIACIICKDEIG